MCRLIYRLLPKWYVNSCNEILYIFPKAHAVIYTMMAFKIAYYKAHYPKEFYEANFSVRYAGYDEYKKYDKEQMEKYIRDKRNSEDEHEKDICNLLELRLEMLE
jgi:DNA polymerase-3 subunit alpha (Gram-positive type)